MEQLDETYCRTSRLHEHALAEANRRESAAVAGFLQTGHDRETTIYSPDLMQTMRRVKQEKWAHRLLVVVISGQDRQTTIYSLHLMQAMGRVKQETLAHLLLVVVISEAHAQIGHIGLLDVIALGPGLPVVLMHPVHLHLHVQYTIRTQHLM